MEAAAPNGLLKEAIEELKKDFLDRIPPPPHPMAPFRWPGGKGKLVKWIIQYVPTGHIYVEPFAGAASVFWHLPNPFPKAHVPRTETLYLNFSPPIANEGGLF